MSARKIRRAAAHKALKLARKAGFPIPQPSPAPPAEPIIPNAASETIPEPGFPFPSLASISPARLSANRANSLFSTGPTSPAGLAVSAQNHTSHGLARRLNGTFKLLTSEDSATYETFKQSLVDEHQPSTETESILVNSMAESHWLSQRAQRLQDTCIDPATGAIVNEKTFSLYMRYHTTHTRAFHKSFHDLLRLRAERRKSETGFEAQKIANEKHEMKKQSHYWTVLKKDAEACHQISANTIQNLKARAENPAFEAEYAAELAKHQLEVKGWEVASQAA